MRLRGIGRGFIPPGYGVDIEAIAGIAGALGWEIHRKCERSQLRVLTNDAGGKLIGSRGEPYFDPGLCAVIRVHTCEPGRGRAGMITCAVAERIRLKMREAADDVQLIVYRLERFED